MPDSLPAAQWWESAVNVLSGGSFSAVPDRATILSGSWLTSHHFSWTSGKRHVIYTYGYQTWQAYADYDSNKIASDVPSSDWQKFYDGAFTIMSGSTRLPYQTETAQWDSFRAPDGLSGPITGVLDWLNANTGTIRAMRNSVAEDESTIHGQAADVIWQILDRFEYGMNFVAGQLQKGLDYLREAADLLVRYHDALVAAWNRWIAGDSGTSFDTGKGYQLPDSPRLVSPVGCLNAMARVLTFNNGIADVERGLALPVPDHFAPNHGLASWGMWQEIEAGAKRVWQEKLKQLDAPEIKTAFDALVDKYRMSTSALQLTAPVFPPIDAGSPNGPNGGGSGGPNVNDLVNNLLNNRPSPPPGAEGAGGGPNLDDLTDALGGDGGDGGLNLDNLTDPLGGDGGDGGLNLGDLTDPLGSDGGLNLGNLTDPLGSDGGPVGGFVPPLLPPTLPPGGLTPPPGGPGTGVDGYLVPDGKGGYEYHPSSDFITTPAPAGAVPGRMITGPDGKQVFQPSSIGSTPTAPENSTPGFLVPDGKGGYEFKPASEFPNASDVPTGSIAGYQVNDGDGKSHFVPSGAGAGLDDDPLNIPPLNIPPLTNPPPISYAPPPTVSSGTGLDVVRPAQLSVDSNGEYLTPPAPISNFNTSSTDPSTGQSTGSSSGVSLGAAGPAAAQPVGGGVPLYPPTAGMGGMGGQGGQGGQDRQRTTWLSEDEKVWGTDRPVAPAVLGRGKRKRRAGEEEELDYATFGGQRPRSHAGQSERPEDQDRRSQGGTGGTAGV
ncbi:hypothetical protein AB0H83_32030 [Dactylosporangium sp. NPDC050688]|uniref:hypothetical protein n=1 Tax=Dactylosporangium sp. NPDC050688 TaxID=3157217 RepID=UPI0033FB64E6